MIDVDSDGLIDYPEVEGASTELWHEMDLVMEQIQAWTAIVSRENSGGGESNLDIESQKQMIEEVEVADRDEL